MKKVSGFSLLSCVLCAALMLSCGSDNTATVMINIGLPKGVSAAPAHDGFFDRLLGFFVAPAYAQTAPEDVTAIGITVIGPNMVPFNKIYPADTTVVSLAINAGKKRRIAVRGIDNTGRPKYIGSKIVNLEAGSMQTVRIDMGENLHFIDINPNSATGSNPSGMTLYKNKVYFQGTTTETGAELWAYDLATDTASLVADIRNVENASSSPTQLTVFDGKLYFSAYNGSGNDLWCYDGVNVPVQVTDLNLMYGLSRLTVIGERLFFVSEMEYAVYCYSETDGLVQLYYEGSPIRDASGFTLYNNTVCFSARDDTNTDYEFYVFDPENGTSRYIIETDTAYSSYPDNFVVLDDVLFFAAETVNNGRELYTFNGTDNPALIEMLGEGSSNPTDMTVVGDRIYFSAVFSIFGTDTELYAYDESLAIQPDDDKFISVDNFLETRLGNSILNDVTNPHDLLGIGPVLFFTASDPTNGYSLWMHNALTLNTVQLFNIDSGSSNIMSTMRAGIYLVFVSPGGSGDLWIYNPLSAVINGESGQNPYKLEVNDSGTSNAGNVFAVDNKVFFSAQDSSDVNELWTYEIY